MAAFAGGERRERSGGAVAAIASPARLAQRLLQQTYHCALRASLLLELKVAKEKQQLSASKANERGSMVKAAACALLSRICRCASQRKHLRA